MKQFILLLLIIILNILNKGLTCNLKFIRLNKFKGYQKPKLYPIPFCEKVNSTCCKLEDQLKMLDVKIELKNYYNNIIKSKIEKWINSVIETFEKFIKIYLENALKGIHDEVFKRKFFLNIKRLKEFNYEVSLREIIKNFEDIKVKSYKLKLNYFCLLCDYKGQFHLNSKEKAIIMSKNMCNALLDEFYKFIYSKYKLYSNFIDGIIYFYKIFAKKKKNLGKNWRHKVFLKKLKILKNFKGIMEDCELSKNKESSQCLKICRFYSFTKFGSIFEFNFMYLNFFKKMFNNNGYGYLHNRVLISENKIEEKADNIQNRIVDKLMKNRRRTVFNIIKHDDSKNTNLKRFINVFTQNEKYLYKGLVRKKIIRSLLERYKEFLERVNQKNIDSYLNLKHKNNLIAGRPKRNNFYIAEWVNMGYFFKNYKVKLPRWKANFIIFSGEKTIGFKIKYKKIIREKGIDLMNRDYEFNSSLNYESFKNIILYKKFGNQMNGLVSPKEISEDLLNIDTNNKKLWKYEDKINDTINLPATLSMNKNEDKLLGAINKINKNEIIEFKNDVGVDIPVPQSNLKNFYNFKKCKNFKKICYYNNLIDFHCKKYCINACEIKFVTDNETGLKNITKICRKKFKKKKINFKKVKYMKCGHTTYGSIKEVDSESYIRNLEISNIQIKSLKAQVCRKKTYIFIPFHDLNFFLVDYKNRYNDADIFNLRKVSNNKIRGSKSVVLKCNKQLCIYIIDNKYAYRVHYKKNRECNNIKGVSKCIIFYNEHMNIKKDKLTNIEKKAKKELKKYGIRNLKQQDTIKITNKKDCKKLKNRRKMKNCKNSWNRCKKLEKKQKKCYKKTKIYCERCEENDEDYKYCNFCKKHKGDKCKVYIKSCSMFRNGFKRKRIKKGIKIHKSEKKYIFIFKYLLILNFFFY